MLTVKISVFVFDANGRFRVKKKDILWCKRMRRDYEQASTDNLYCFPRKPCQGDTNSATVPWQGIKPITSLTTIFSFAFYPTTIV